MSRLKFGVVASVLLAWTGPATGGQFEPPRQLMAAGQPIDTQRKGHAAPFVADFDGDGLRDLLVGEFHMGRMRVFRNTGTNARPVFGKHEWFRAGGLLGRVPSD